MRADLISVRVRYVSRTRASSTSRQAQAQAAAQAKERTAVSRPVVAARRPTPITGEADSQADDHMEAGEGVRAALRRGRLFDRREAAEEHQALAYACEDGRGEQERPRGDRAREGRRGEGRRRYQQRDPQREGQDPGRRGVLGEQPGQYGPEPQAAHGRHGGDERRSPPVAGRFECDRGGIPDKGLLSLSPRPWCRHRRREWRLSVNIFDITRNP
ncbi:hypothetical protein BU197_20470 [Streptomyces sp. CBMA291]|nr:hypothetical protein [Streptomyces sp. CBMA291]MBD0715509.1 hypothetical protein [Streptomyces sp. CBMA370]